MAQGALPKCLRVMHLAWEGHVNLDSLTDIWEHLPEFLLAELLRGFLGRMCSSRNNLLGYLSCACLLYTSPSPRDKRQSRMPSSA